MNDQLSEHETESPGWDVALEALAREHFDQLDRPLYMDDFQHLAQTFAIRLDDILETMFELVIRGHWRYTPKGAKAQAITREVLNNLYVGGRLHAADVKEYTGHWQPAR